MESLSRWFRKKDGMRQIDVVSNETNAFAFNVFAVCFPFFPFVLKGFQKRSTGTSLVEVKTHSSCFLAEVAQSASDALLQAKQASKLAHEEAPQMTRLASSVLCSRWQMSSAAVRRGYEWAEPTTSIGHVWWFYLFVSPPPGYRN